MNIGETIRNYRLQKGMSQGDIEKRTGLLRCYLSRVENGHTIPSLDTLAKIAGAMEIGLQKSASALRRRSPLSEPDPPLLCQPE
jgi:transcriptional regulator with XRE-family HTH domain